MVGTTFRFGPIPVVLFGGALGLILALAISGCKDNENCTPYNSHQYPQAAAVIRINESNFNPSDVTVSPGLRVEWQNRFKEARTVTSFDPKDSTKTGEIFDVTLLGYCPGEAIGGRFQFVAPVVEAPDTIYYLNSNLPPGFAGSFTGRIIVAP